MARKILRARDAPNDGVRRLRELVRFQSAAQLAKKLGCDSTAVRRWARATRTPEPEWRDIMRKQLGIPLASWELEADDDDAMTRPAG
jgi:ribosome-binding protein aMBF1 (putative translation factor)